MESEKEQFKRMADLLKSGATMLFEHCPECNSPLFKMGDEVRCPKCNRRVVIVKSEEEMLKAQGPPVLEAVEEVVLAKLQETVQQLKDEKDPDRLQKLGDLLTTWIGLVEKMKRLKAA